MKKRRPVPNIVSFRGLVIESWPMVTTIRDIDNGWMKGDAHGICLFTMWEETAGWK